MAVWAPILTTIRDHRRSAEAGDRAMWLYTCMHLFCKERDTNGRVSVHELKTLNAQRGKESLTKRLVRVGYLEEIDGGWRIAKYDEKGPKAAVKEEIRTYENQRKNKQRKGDVPEMSRTPVPEMSGVRAEQSRAEQTISSEIDALAAEAVSQLRIDWGNVRCDVSDVQLFDLIEREVGPVTVELAGRMRTALAADKRDNSRDWQDGTMVKLSNWIKQGRWDTTPAKSVANKFDAAAKAKEAARA